MCCAPAPFYRSKGRERDGFYMNNFQRYTNVNSIWNSTVAVRLKSTINNKFQLLSRRKVSSLAYWEERSKQYGRKSVLNLGHLKEEFETVTENQKKILFPLFKQQLSGREKSILDFGCGPGRFTLDLAELIHGYAVGADPIKHLLDLAPGKEDACYIQIEENNIPLGSDSVDIIWICLVLGGHNQ